MEWIGSEQGIEEEEEQSKILVSYNEWAFKILLHEEAYNKCLVFNVCECECPLSFLFVKKKTDFLKIEMKPF
jgi:hypothetical protein